MELEFRELLSGVDNSVCAKLAENDIRSLSDAQLLTTADLKELGFSIGVRNKLTNLFKAGPAAANGGASAPSPSPQGTAKTPPRKGAAMTPPTGMETGPPNLAKFCTALNYVSDSMKEKRATIAIDQERVPNNTYSAIKIASYSAAVILSLMGGPVITLFFIGMIITTGACLEIPSITNCFRPCVQEMLSMLHMDSLKALVGLTPTDYQLGDGDALD